MKSFPLKKINRQYQGFYMGFHICIYKRPHGGFCCEISAGKQHWRQGYHGTFLATLPQAKNWGKDKIEEINKAGSLLVSRMVSVNDRLPAPSKIIGERKYLIRIADGCYAVTEYLKGSKSKYSRNKKDGFRDYRGTDGGYNIYDRVTHWMLIQENEPK